MSTALVVFAKNPQIQQVKTRLGKDIGYTKAVALYEAMLEDCLCELQNLKDADLYIGCADGIKHVFWKNLSNKYNAVLIEQDGNDLGERMLNCVDSLAAKHNAVVIVGSDTPRINSEFIQLAVQNYNGWQVLLGPCKDGGFYLFGAKQAHRNIFDNVLWSKEQVMLTTLLNCEKLSLAVRLLPESEDIDDLNSLQSVRPKLNSKNSNLVKIIEQLELVQ